MNRGETGQRVGVEGVVMRLADPPERGWDVIAPATIERSQLLSGVAASSSADVWVVGQAAGRPLAMRWDGSAWTAPSSPPVPPALIGAGLEGVAIGHPGSAEAIAAGGGYDRLAGTEVPLIQHWDGSSWSLANPGPPARDYVLTDIAMVAPGEAWAVGHGFPRKGSPDLVALHWSKGDWHPVETPTVAKGKLLAVSGSSPQDLWAVGAAGRSGLIVHYDGSTWRMVPSPTTRFPLSDVAALSPTEAWCVGGGSVLRWNGRKWARVNVPIDSANTVTALSAEDVWVGGGNGELAHFDGRHWSRVTSPEPLNGTTVWRASTASPPGAPADSTVWMVGAHRHSEPQPTDRDRTITAHHHEP